MDLEPGDFELSVEATNTWRNRMFYDSERPESERIALTHNRSGWFEPGETSLERSGLIGPITLKSQKR